MPFIHVYIYSVYLIRLKTSIAAMRLRFVSYVRGYMDVLTETELLSASMRCVLSRRFTTSKYYSLVSAR
jgi:hypothetical protein